LDNMLDNELLDGLRIIKLYEEEAKHNDFEKLCKIAKPILHRLINTNPWRARDLEFITIAVLYNRR